MTWLLDTHALLWALFEPGKLGRKTHAILDDRVNEVLVNPVSYWEISLKYGLGKLEPNTLRARAFGGKGADGMKKEILSSNSKILSIKSAARGFHFFASYRIRILFF